MAGAVWGIDIGKAALKAVKLKRTKDGLEIKAVEHFEYEPTTEEDKRQEQVRSALKSFLAKHKVGSDTVLVALPGLHAFSRFIKLPPVDAAKIGMMVRMEAQQQIPFPIAEVNWDFQKIDKQYAPGEEIEVGIFATRREVIEGYLRELTDATIQPGVVTIAPLAIYNFVKYNCEVGEGATVVLDIGSDHTDLVIIDGPKFWLRNLRIAGNDITKALAERFKVSFEEAEKLKRTASKSEQSKKIFSSMEPTLKDLVGEVHRSVGFYKSQSGGDLKITKMILLGDGAKLKNLPPFFEKELGYTIDKVQTLGQDKFLLDPEADREILKKHILGFGVAFGLAIQGVHEPGACSINLAPDDVKIQEELKRKVPLALAAAACSWLALVVSFVGWSKAKDQLAATVKESAPIKKYKDLQEEAKKLEEAPAGVKKTAEERLALVQGRMLPLEFLAKLKELLPKDNNTIVDFPMNDRKPSGGGWVSLANQIAKINDARKDLDTKKLWVLDLNIDRKPATIAEAGKLASPEGVYTVELKVAKYLPGSATSQQIREQIRTTFVTSLIQALKGEPFNVRNPEKALPDGYGEVDVKANEEISQLEKDTKGTPQGVELKCVMLPIRFEIGGPAPAAAAPPPATPPGEEKKEGNK
jgi:type IV pilus assembly protein PilM